MYTYSQLKNYVYPPPPPPQGVNGVPYVPKLYASSGIDISKCIEDGNMKTLVDYIYICVQSRMHIRVKNVIFLNVFNFLKFFLNHLWGDLVKAKPP